MDQTKITASQLVNLLEILYVLVIDYVDNGAERRPDAETAEELKHLGKPAVAQWGEQLPALRDSINAALAGRSKANQLALLGQEVKETFQDFRANERFTSQEIELLRALGAYLRTDSDIAFQKIKKFAGLMNNPFISKRMAPKVGNQKKSSNGLRALIRKMVGRDDTALTKDEADIVKETQPDMYKQYMAYRKEHNQVWRDAMVSYVRQSGHSTVPYEELIEYLMGNGIQHMLPIGFTGMVDDQGRLYTNDGHRIDGVPSVVNFPTISMNTKYGKPGAEHYVFQAIRPNGGPGPYFYTADFKKAASRAKFEKVADLAPKINSMQKQWFQLVKKFNPQDVRCVAATILELLYEFSARIGSKGNAAGGKSTYGISTLLVRHVAVDSSGNMVIRYLGKDQVKFVHKLMKSDPQQRFVIANIMHLMNGKQPRDRLFTVASPTGRLKPVGGATANQLFRSMGAPAGVTVHKLRTFRGTAIFKELMEKVFDGGRLPKTEQAANLLFNKMAMAVGKALNHVRRGANGATVTGTTALANYISPDIQIAFWRQLGFRPPKSLEKFDVIGRGLPEDDE